MTTVSEHYGRVGLGATILEALQRAGKDVERLSPDDLAPIDHFHTRGKDATLELGELAGIGRSMRVLDVGGGLGGPARTLAHTLGCRVTVLDLTDEFCRVGADLTRRTGLEDVVTFQHGSALEMPFGDGEFDIVWTQHSSMNIEDKEQLYREINRVVRPEGRLAMHEIMAGTNAPPLYPVPWAREPSISFLREPAAVRALIARLGFAEVAWIDETSVARDWFRRLQEAQAASGPPTLGVHLLLGAHARAMFASQVRNLEESRIAIIKAVWQRP